MTNEQLAKLPKWAKYEFRSMQNKINALRKEAEEDLVSPIYIDNCVGELCRRYIDSRSVYIEHCGVQLHVIVDKLGSLRLYTNLIGPHLFDDYVALIPQATNLYHIIKTRRVKE